MKKVIYHMLRLIRKFGFILFFAFVISPIFGLGVLVIATILSMLLFSDPIEEKDNTDYFTEDELKKINSDEMIDDEEYLTLLAKYQTFKCPVKVDEITTWTSSEVTRDSFICNYEVKDRWHKYGDIDMNVVKSNILAKINKNGVNVKRVIATNRNLIYRYWNFQEETYEDIVLSKDELRS